MKITRIHKKDILKRVALILLCIAVGWFLKSKLTPKTASMGATGGVPYVVVQAVEEQKLSKNKEEIGLVEAINSVEIVPEVSGEIKEVLFTEGSFVNQGDVLFKIDDENVTEQFKTFVYDYYYDLDEVAFVDNTYMYDGNEHEILIDGVLPYGTHVVYENNKLTEIGNKQATAKIFDEENITYRNPFGGGSGAGVSIKPVAFIVIQGKTVKLLHVEHSCTIDKVLDYMPELCEKAEKMMDKIMNKKNEADEIEVHKPKVKKVNVDYKYEYKPEEDKIQDE